MSHHHDKPNRGDILRQKLNAQVYDAVDRIENASTEAELATELTALRQLRQFDEIDATNFIHLAHALSFDMYKKITDESTHEQKKRAKAASEVAAFAGLDAPKVKNNYRHNATTSGEVLILDQIESIYSHASDDEKEQLDRHYCRLYGLTCPELIAKIDAPHETRRLSPATLKKSTIGVIGATVTTAVALGAAPATAASIDLPSASGNALSIERAIADMSAPIEGTITPQISEDELIITQPSDDTAGEEIMLDPIDSYTPVDETEGEEISLDPISPDTPEDGTGMIIDVDTDADTEAETDKDEEPQIEPDTEQDDQQTVAPAPEKVEAETKTEKEQTPADKPEQPKAAEEAPKKAAPAPKAKEQEKEAKEAKAYKVFTDYVYDKTEALKNDPSNERWHPMDPDKLIKLIDKYYEKYKDENNGVVDREYVAAVLFQESKFDPTQTSGAADGLGQFTPGTVATVNKHIDFTDPWDPEQSTEATFWYYNFIYEKFDNYSKEYNWSKAKNTVEHKLEMALAGYNSGPNRAIYKKGNMPDIGETNKYRKIIMDDYRAMKSKQAKILDTAANAQVSTEAPKKKAAKAEAEEASKIETEQTSLEITGYAYSAKGKQKLDYVNQRFDNGSAPYAGGEMKDYGCGPSSLATIISTLSGKEMSNVEVGKILNQHGAMAIGSGTDRSYFDKPNHAVFKDLGIKVERIPRTSEAFEQTIKKHGMVLIREQGKVFATGASGRQFAHFMVVTGYNNQHSPYDNEDRKFYIADPNGNQGTNWTKNPEGFSFSTLKGANRPRTGNMTDAWAVTLIDDGVKKAPHSGDTTQTVAKKQTQKPVQAKAVPAVKKSAPKTEVKLPATVEPKAPEPKPEQADEPKATNQQTEMHITEAPSGGDEIELSPISPFAAAAEKVTSANTNQAPQTLIEGEPVAIRHNFDPREVVATTPTLTKEQLRKLKSY